MVRKNVLFFAVLTLVSSLSFAKKEKTEVVFGIKSGVIIMAQDPDSREEMEEMFANMPRREGAMGMDSTMADMFSSWGGDQKIYFDDYGLKQATVSGSSRTVVDPKDGATVTINDQKKTGTKMPNFGGMGGMGGGSMRSMAGKTGFTYGSNGKLIDWLNMDEKLLKKNHIKYLGEEELQGVVCKKYSMKTAQFQTVVNNTYWVYKGIVLQTETDSEWGSMGAMKFAKIEENVNVPAELFEIGEDIKVSEPNFGGFGGGGFGGGGFGGGGFGGGF